jgi:2',3'-cyclic-nucleotide 2'-phosphodiesterase (5'-nucleotidase family)
LLRQDGSLQDRSTANYNIASNFLDIATINGITEDNSNYTELVSTNGFIQGPIKDNSQKLLVNDQLIVITQANIMQAVQKRVAAEVKQCLNDYALNNNGRYPWAVPVTDISTYDDAANQLFGRIPDTLNATNSSSSNSMDNKWSGNCNTHSNNNASDWWKDWRELVFYSLSNAYKPDPTPPAPGCTACLTVTNDSTMADKKFIVIVSGKKLPAQARTTTADKMALSNYLESPNSSGSSVFLQSSETANFNDTLVFLK